ncbi:MAG: ATP-binding protein [Erysipelothrix sp.]|jgi:predicted AAA+ superfamily ATPase|nr:ATP-binding protein [Erysipelothrix sp.]
MAIDKQIIMRIIVDRIRNIKKLSIKTRETKAIDHLSVIYTGIRRSGKSFLLYQVMNELVKKGHEWDEFLYINFEDERLIGFDINDFDLLIEAHHTLFQKEPIFFLDEIQNISGWEKFARRMADEKRTIYITGSNSKMLSHEMERTLGGRYLAILVYPYSYDEFLSAKQVRITNSTFYSIESRAILLGLLDEYLHFGGFPEITELINKRDYLSNLYNKIFLGDIISRYSISNKSGLEVLLKKVAESVRQPISYSRLLHIVQSVGYKVGKSTIIQYIEYCKESYLLFSLSNLGAKFVDKNSTPKYYFMDTGLLNLFLIDANPALLENCIALELIRNEGQENVYYYQDNVEVDFVIPSKSTAIQACYSLNDLLTKEREVNALVKISKFMKIKNNIIITYDQEDTITVDDITIQVIPSWKWLLKRRD